MKINAIVISVVYRAHMRLGTYSAGAQLCLILYDPMDCSPPGSSVHGILQARVLEWGAIAFSSLTLNSIIIICLVFYFEEVT